MPPTNKLNKIIQEEVESFQALETPRFTSREVDTLINQAKQEARKEVAKQIIDDISIHYTGRRNYLSQEYINALKDKFNI